jgi:hypothetical protein
MRWRTHCAHCGERLTDEAVELDGSAYCDPGCAMDRDDLLRSDADDAAVDRYMGN